MFRFLFLMITILSIHLLAGLSMAKNSDPDYLSRINKAITRTDNKDNPDLEMLKKRLIELEKKVEKLEKQHQLRAIPLNN